MGVGKEYVKKYIQIYKSMLSIDDRMYQYKCLVCGYLTEETATKDYTYEIDQHIELAHKEKTL